MVDNNVKNSTSLIFTGDIGFDKYMQISGIFLIIILWMPDLMALLTRSALQKSMM